MERKGKGGEEEKEGRRKGRKILIEQQNKVLDCVESKEIKS